MERYVDIMAINITDVCNMECPHCMRGDSRGSTLPLSLIPRLFDGVRRIDCVVITGGEPACYPEGVMAIADYICENRDTLDVNGLYIATNGKTYCQELVDAVKQVMFLKIEKEYGNDREISCMDRSWLGSSVEELSYTFGVAVSLDDFHDPISIMNYARYKTSGVYSDAKEYSYAGYGVISRGRGAGIHGSQEKPYREISVTSSDDGKELECGTIYVNVEGLVFGDCDMSYEMEDSVEPAGDLNEMPMGKILDKKKERKD